MPQTGRDDSDQRWFIMPGPDDANNAPPKRRPLRLVLSVIVPLVIVWFIARSIINNWAAINAHEWGFHGGWLALASALYLFVIVFLVQLWAGLLKAAAGRTPGLARAYRISALANLGKYLPGKVWTVMGVIYLLKKDGYSAGSTFAASMLHQAFTILAGATFALLTLGMDFWRGQQAWPAAIGFGLCLIILYPPLFTRCLNWGLRLVRREPISIRLTLPRSLLLFVLYLVAWAAYGASFWCFLRGVGLENLPFWKVAAASCGAYLVGFLALFAPGGLGVREGILAVLLAPYMGPGIPAAVAVLSRLWMTIVELVGLAPLLTPWGRQPQARND